MEQEILLILKGGDRLLQKFIAKFQGTIKPLLDRLDRPSVLGELQSTDGYGEVDAVSTPF